MREGGRKLAQIIKKLGDKIEPNISTWELDKLAEKLVFDIKGFPAFKGYGAESGNPFPATICASLNEEVVHGIPSKNVILKNGDIIKVDIGMKYKGMFTDMARTFLVGDADVDAKKITETVKESLDRGIKKIKPGKNIGEYSKEVQSFVEKRGFSVIRNLVGHGVGRHLHEDPQIPNYEDSRFGSVILKPGMTLALEPMINVGTYETVLGDDGWVYKTADGQLSAHWENTVLVTEKGVEILTKV